MSALANMLYLRKPAVSEAARAAYGAPGVKTVPTQLLSVRFRYASLHVANEFWVDADVLARSSESGEEELIGCGVLVRSLASLAQGSAESACHDN